jgi:hypothetical protein
LYTHTTCINATAHHYDHDGITTTTTTTSLIYDNHESRPATITPPHASRNDKPQDVHESRCMSEAFHMLSTKRHPRWCRFVLGVFSLSSDTRRTRWCLFVLGVISLPPHTLTETTPTSMSFHGRCLLFVYHVRRRSLSRLINILLNNYIYMHSTTVDLIPSPNGTVDRFCHQFHQFLSQPM